MSAYSDVKKKCKDFSSIKTIANTWRSEGKIIVFTNGCFDLLHLGHVDYLSKAADLGDVLIVGMNSDDSVRRLKGHHRPLQNAESRSLLMASLQFVSAVVVFDENTPMDLIRAVKPDILVKGGDYTEETVVGAEIVKRNGGKVLILPFLEGHSTSAIEVKIVHGGS